MMKKIKTTNSNDSIYHYYRHENKDHTFLRVKFEFETDQTFLVVKCLETNQNFLVVRCLEMDQII